MMVREIRREACPRGWWTARCTDCGIRFLSRDWDPHSEEPRCPFGCRQRRAAKLSAERVRIYYQSPEGKAKKRELNRRRNRRAQEPAVGPLKPLPSHDSFPSRILIEHAVLVAGLIQVKLSIELIREVLIASRMFWRQLNLEYFGSPCETDMRRGKSDLWPP